jgi:hypothetical protein
MTQPDVFQFNPEKITTEARRTRRKGIEKSGGAPIAELHDEQF